MKNSCGGGSTQSSEGQLAASGLCTHDPTVLEHVISLPSVRFRREPHENSLYDLCLLSACQVSQSGGNCCKVVACAFFLQKLTWESWDIVQPIPVCLLERHSGARSIVFST